MSISRYRPASLVSRLIPDSRLTQMLRVVGILAMGLLSKSVLATEIEGYAEPFRIIEVASDETGVIDEMLVNLGDQVRQGDPIMRLRSDMHEAQLAIAKQQMSVTGRKQATDAEVELTQLRLKKIRDLQSTGHARVAEVSRAENEYKVAVANQTSIKEELETRRLEHERLVSQLARRTLHAPCDGVVTEVHRELGEFVAPNQPQIITLVQIDRLLANFALMPSQVSTLSTHQPVRIRFNDSNSQIQGTVHFISPVINAESGTILVQVLIDNGNGRFRSGERCTIKLKD
ncbi:efflux RND transporter periplasmic adaptor subunit [Stieleria sp. JC731]|uniref:efflux RND transporter periplasmic adaptor subunit n=1 Tax=Pirellulaceae TaxID=2691357 RepID=UPI001E6521EB|nr:efflux RND transporter periplasmic adaptor subunit [Stieleria sp. JC731]MCC9599922.1 efflux RND transporter periplasmic adaptor subunit [Stieleria sp. JC731]